jgi:GT2 family glycosyltransferase
VQKKADIIMPVWDAIEVTKACLESIFTRTQFPFRVIVIDNNSAGDAAAYLKRLHSEGKIDLIKNEENLGFIKAVNQGMRKSNAPYVCLINNDTLVTRGWLGRMIGILEDNNDIGIVNPSSNNLGIHVPKNMTLEEYAKKISSSGEGFTELGAAIGFCMCIKREVMDKIGYMDEIYGMGNFEDSDFSKRAQEAGYKSVMAKGSYVYHRQSESFKKRKSRESDFKKNQKIFYERWGRPRHVLYVSAGGPGAGGRSNILESARSGNWVFVYTGKYDDELENHGQISQIADKRFFALRAVAKALVKKKRFEEIYTDNASLAGILGLIGFFRPAKIIKVNKGA